VYRRNQSAVPSPETEAVSRPKSVQTTPTRKSGSPTAEPTSFGSSARLSHEETKPQPRLAEHDWLEIDREIFRSRRSWLLARIKASFKFHFDLVILCHSIPARDRDRLTCLIRASGSLTPVISVACVAQDSSGSDAFASATVESQPVKLLAGIKDVLAQTRRRQTDYANPHRKKG
jgi:hypothetical protein